MNRVVHFEISANEPEKVIAFYQNVFGWEITKWNGPQEYWLVRTGSNEPGIDGAIFKPNEMFTGTVNSIEVEDIDRYMQKVRDCGGQVVVDKMAIPKVGFLAYCKDVEGTIFGITQMEPQAVD